MKAYRFLAVLVLALVLGLFSASSEIGAETKTFLFRARTTFGTVSSTTDILDGDYNVAVSNGKCEVTRPVDQKENSVGRNSAAELCRMVGVDPDKRMYVDPSKLKVGEEWSQSFNYNVPGIGRTLRKTASYQVKESDAQGKIFKIEGSSTVRDRDG